MKRIANILGTPISEDIVFWLWPGKHTERQHLFNQLKREISGLKGLSLRDRDNQDFNTVTQRLVDKSNKGCDKDGLAARTWRYRYIETYLLSSSAIARAAKVEEKFVIEDARAFGIDLSAFTTTEILPGLQDFSSKSLLTEGKDCLVVKYKISKYDVVDNMFSSEIHQDFKEIIS